MGGHEARKHRIRGISTMHKGLNYNRIIDTTTDEYDYKHAAADENDHVLGDDNSEYGTFGYL